MKMKENQELIINTRANQPTMHIQLFDGWLLNPINANTHAANQGFQRTWSLTNAYL